MYIDLEVIKLYKKWTTLFSEHGVLNSNCSDGIFHDARKHCQFRNRRIYDHNFSKTIRRTFLSPVIFTRVQFYACYVIETCLYWEHHAVMEVSLMSVNFSLKWLPSQEIKLYLFKLIEFMCATFEVQITNGLIDEMKWGKLNTLSLSQFRVWPLRSNRQLRFDKKDVYGN